MMEKRILWIIMGFLFLSCISSFCGGDPESGDIHVEGILKGIDIVIDIEPGEEWIHVEPYNNAPTFAVWITDEEGNYIETIYVTKKAATQDWSFARGDKRKEKPREFIRGKNSPYDAMVLLDRYYTLLEGF